MSRATRAEIAVWEARLDKANAEADFQRERAEVAERKQEEAHGAFEASAKIIDTLYPKIRGLEAELADHKNAHGQAVQLLMNIAAMGAALAQKVEGKG